MFISPINSLNCKKPKKITFCVNPNNVTKVGKEIVENIPVKEHKTLLGKWLDDFFKGVAKNQEESPVDPTFLPFGGFNPDMINPF